MNCPSCYHDNVDSARYCTRCRMSFSPANLFLTRVREHIFWILRRSNAGFVAGLIAWFFVPIVTRILSQGSSDMFIFVITGLMGGAFLGCVDGMVDESSPKTVRGAIFGGIGGAIGGIVFVTLKETMSASKILWSIFLYWAIAGAFIGTVSALWEGHKGKILVGILSGFIGGGIGGYLGAAVHANLIQEFSPESWLVQRLFEALIGGFIGVTLWFFLGMAERLFIFKRQLVKSKDHKECDKCHTKNPLSSWYCGSCGRVLQVSVPSNKLNLPRYRTLYRVSEMFRFLSRLSAATGFIAGFVSFFIFIPGPVFMMVGILVLVALFSYTLQVIFSSLSEGVQVYINR